MASLTLGQLLTNVATNLGDVNTSGTPTYTYWSQATLTGWLNQAVTEVCADAQLLKQYVVFVRNPVPVLTAHATAEYVPGFSGGGIQQPTTGDMTNLDQIIMLQAGNIVLEQKAVTDIALMFPDFDTRTGTPRFFSFNDWGPGIIRLFPDPGETLTTVRGIATLKPNPMSASGDVPPFDSEFHVLCEWYATFMALTKKGEAARSSANPETYERWYREGKARLKAKQGRNFSHALRTIPHDNF